MKAAVWILAVVGILLPVGYFGHHFLVVRDFNKICDVHRDVLAKAATETPRRIDAEIAYDIANQIDNALITSPARNTYRAINFAAAAEKYELFKTSAKESGIPDWTCPEMQSYLKPPADPSL